MPAAAPEVAASFVRLDALRSALDGVDWAPLRLATGRAGRPASPRLPHALALHLAHAARTDGSAASGAVVPDRPRLAALLAADVSQVDGALDALRRAAVVAGGDVEPAVCLTPAVLGPAPRCGALDWTGLASATAGSPSAWIAAHALAERLERHHWTPVPRADLEHTLGSGASGARGALERLVAAGVVERREQRGGVSVYRFADGAWDGGGRTPVTAPVAAPRAATALAALPAPPPAPRTEPAPGVRLILGGVEVEVPAGLRARVEVGPDGRPTLTLLPAS